MLSLERWFNHRGLNQLFFPVLEANLSIRKEGQAFFSEALGTKSNGKTRFARVLHFLCKTT